MFFSTSNNHIIPILNEKFAQKARTTPLALRTSLVQTHVAAATALHIKFNRRTTSYAQAYLRKSKKSRSDGDVDLTARSAGMLQNKITTVETLPLAVDSQSGEFAPTGRSTSLVQAYGKRSPVPRAPDIRTLSLQHLLCMLYVFLPVAYLLAQSPQ